jgi:hypothetical protein
MGAAIRKEKVTPNGIPASTNPMNKGTAEQEQNGVTTPNRLASIFPTKSGFPSSALLVFSGEKKLLMIPTIKMIETSNKNTCINCNTKKCSAAVKY